MNKTQFIFALAFILISFNTAFAQYGYGNGYGNGYGGGGYGMNRNSMSQMDQTPSKPKEIPVEVTVAKIMEKLKGSVNFEPGEDARKEKSFFEKIKDAFS